MSNQQKDRSFAALDERAHEGELVFRVYTDLSASPLVWTGDPATSGFFAPSGYLAISPSVYTRLLSDSQTAYSLVDGQYGRHSLVDHILGKEKQTCVSVPSSIQERDRTPEDDKSCWVSCTASLVWAIWEAARRIAVEGCSEVHVAVIGRNPKKQIEPAGGGPPDYAGREISIIPGRSILAGLREGRAQQLFSMNTREAYETAAQQAAESAEVLYYGRIFAESIEADLVFTRELLPIEPPPYFFASSFARTDQPRNACGPAASDKHVRACTNARSQSSSPRKPCWRASSSGTLGGAIASSKAQVVHGRDRDSARGGTDHAGTLATTPHPPSLIPPTADETWLDRLIWDPQTDTFRSAVRAIARRRSELDVYPREELKTVMH